VVMPWRFFILEIINDNDSYLVYHACNK